MAIEIELPEFGNQVVSFPDGTTNEQIAQELGLAANRQRFPTNNAAAIAMALQPALSQFGSQAPAASTLADVGPGGGIGLTPEQTLANLDSIQQDEQQNEVNRLRQQAQNRAIMAQQQEEEKDRAQQIKVESQRFKNQQAIQKLRGEQAIAADARESEAKAKAPVTLSPGQVQFDPETGEELLSVPAKEARKSSQVVEGILDGKTVLLRVFDDDSPSKLVTGVPEGFTPTPRGGRAAAADDPIKRTQQVLGIFETSMKNPDFKLTTESASALLRTMQIDPVSEEGQNILQALGLAQQDAEEAAKLGITDDAGPSAFGMFLKERLDRLFRGEPPFGSTENPMAPKAGPGGFVDVPGRN